MVFTLLDQMRAIGVFVQTAEAGNFTRAARSMGVTPQAISAQIRQLEDWMGVRLFHRNTRKMKLSEEGIQFYDKCRDGMEHFKDALSVVSDAKERVVGTVRIAVPELLSRNIFVPVLSTFLEQNPHVSIEVIAINEYPDVIEEGFDIIFMSRHQPRGSFVARKVANLNLSPYATPQYLAKHGIPTSSEDLKRHRCILLRHPHNNKVVPWVFKEGGKNVSVNPPAALITNDVESQRQAVLEGMGIGQVVGYFAAPYARQGLLVPILKSYVGDRFPLFLCTPRRTKLPQKTRVLVDLLLRHLKQNADLQYS